jgi:hypothetical protein
LIELLDVNLKIQQLDVIIETKTKTTFVKLKVSVQFMVIKETVYDAFINWNMHMTKLLLMYLMCSCRGTKIKIMMF